MKMYSIIIFLSFFFSSILIHAQSETDKWVKVEGLQAQRLSVDVTGLEKFKGDDFYVNALEEHNPPLIMETVDGKIYKTKTYYLISKKLLKYSLLNITYYDLEDNVLKNYSYQTNSEIEDYKYNYPILPDSDVEMILNTCLKYLGGAGTKTN